MNFKGLKNQSLFRKKPITLFLSAAMMISTSGCMNNVKQTWEEHGGKIVGGVTGAAVGAIACDGDAACIVAGAVAGVALGALWDKRQKELEALAEKENISLSTNHVETFNSEGQSGLEVAVNSGEMFKVGSPELTPQAQKQFEAVASIYKDTPQQILVMGHTDATGSDHSNLQLSEQRAETVAKLLAEQGIPKEKIFFQGAGESQPVSTNDTKEGRSANRRVEIIEVNSVESVAAYSLQRKSDTRFISNSNKTQVEKNKVSEQIQSASKGFKPVEHLVQVETVQNLSIDENEIDSEQKGSVNLQAEVDFAGKPAETNNSAIVAAGEKVDDSFSFISTAYASDRVSPCFMDSPRIVGGVKNLGSANELDPEAVLKLNEIKQSEYWPGANGSVWMDTVNGNLVALKGLRILSKSGTTVGQTEALIYTDYDKGNKTLNYKMPSHIETYKGTGGLLVRSYFDSDAPMHCMDFVLANQSETDTRAGVLYYETTQGLYEKNVNLHRIKTGK